MGGGSPGGIEEQLMDNLNAFLSSVKRARPASVKGQFVRRMVIVNTMGPGIRMDISEALGGV